MKKYVSLSIGLLYLSLANFCSVYGAIMGHPHSLISLPGVVEEQCDKESDRDHDEHPSDNGALPCHQDSDSSGTCCTKMTQDVPVLLHVTHIETKPTVLISFLLSLPKESAESSVEQQQLFRDHGPPGLISTDPFFLNLRPRSPPII